MFLESRVIARQINGNDLAKEAIDRLKILFV